MTCLPIALSLDSFSDIVHTSRSRAEELKENELLQLNEAVGVAVANRCSTLVGCHGGNVTHVRRPVMSSCASGQHEPEIAFPRARLGSLGERGTTPF